MPVGGCSSSASRTPGSSLRSGLLQWASRITLASPSPAKTSIETRSLVGVRARYVQPFEDSALGGGVDILSASVAEISRVEGALRVDLKRTDNGMPVSLEVDEVIAATGFTCPLQDLPALGVATFGQAKLPAQTAYWESATIPGIHFAGTITSGASGLKKHGIPSYSGAVQGHRYNGRLLVERLAEQRFDIARPRPPIALADLTTHVLAEATNAPELWHQKAYLARVVSVSADDGIRDEGSMPLTHFLDANGSDAIALTIEADGQGAIYPVAYVRRNGKVDEHTLEPHPLHDFEGSAYRKQVGSLLDLIAPGASTA